MREGSQTTAVDTATTLTGADVLDLLESHGCTFKFKQPGDREKFATLDTMASVKFLEDLLEKWKREEEQERGRRALRAFFGPDARFDGCGEFVRVDTGRTHIVDLAGLTRDNPEEMFVRMECGVVIYGQERLAHVSAAEAPMCERCARSLA